MKISKEKEGKNMETQTVKSRLAQKEDILLEELKKGDELNKTVTELEQELGISTQDERII